jgi:hypothetical protein
MAWRVGQRLSQGLFLWRRNPFEIKVISEKPINQESLLFMGGLISKTKDPGLSKGKTFGC